MKKFIMLVIIALALLVNPVFADGNPNNDWVWINNAWVYVGTDPVPSPPPPLKL